jgi:hypothetical protein
VDALGELSGKRYSLLRARSRLRDCDTITLPVAMGIAPHREQPSHLALLTRCSQKLQNRNMAIGRQSDRIFKEEAELEV